MTQHDRDAVVVLENVSKGYPDRSGRGHVEVLRLDRLRLGAGAQMALSGESGRGKTTLLNILAGLTVPDRGRVVIVGTDIAELDERRRDRHRARHMGVVFQSSNLLQGYTALENVELALMLAGRAPRDRAEEILVSVGLGERLHHLPRQLSAGQQQRVALARALANRPRLVLADEPTANLDPRTSRVALDVLRTTCATEGASLVLATHDPAVLASFDERWDLDAMNAAAPPHEATA